MKKYLKTLLCIAFLLADLTVANGVEIGKKAPDFNLKSLSGTSQVSLSGLKGKVILVDFWASWCAPCKISMPHLEKVSKKFENFTVIAINIDDDKKKAVNFLNEYNLDLNAVHDPAKEVVSVYNVPEMPTAYLIDQYGTIQYIHSGYSEAKIRKLEIAIRGLIDNK